MLKQRAEISTLTMLLYGLPGLALAAMTLPLYIVVPTFYAESLGLSVAGIGFALLAVRLFDAVNDPIIGWLADRWRPSFGRRRSWFILSAPIALLGAWKLFWPPTDANLLYLFLWSLVLSIGYTGTMLAYTAWGAELATSYKGRSRISATREMFVLVGTLVAISVPFAIGWKDPAALHGLALLAIGVIVATPLFSLLAISFVPEPKEFSSKQTTLREGIKHLKQNRPFVRLATAFFLNGLGNGLAATLFLLYCSQRLELEAYRGPFLFLYFLSGIAGVPIWTWLAGKTSKHRTWCIAMICAIIVFGWAPFLPAGSIWAFGLICLLSGLCVGADLTLPASMQADVIDVDTAQSGEQRSGVYFSLWSLATKTSLALAVGIVFPVLGWFGFDAATPLNSTAIGVAVLGFLYGWGPILMKIPAILMMWDFPLGESEVASLRQKIELN